MGKRKRKSMKTDAVEFTLGQIVYRKLVPGEAGMVTGILFQPTGHVFHVTWGANAEEAAHFAIELTAEKSFAEANREET